MSSSAPDTTSQGSTSRRTQRRFLILFVVYLVVGFGLLAFQPVNDGVVEPFTTGVAAVSAVSLDALGQEVSRSGNTIRSPSFAVNIYNGCNGVETLVIFFAAIGAFPATLGTKVVGAVLGFLAIQIVNLVRVVALFFTGAYYPELFDVSHTVIWQTIVVLCGVLLWVLWATRFARLRPTAVAA